MEKGNDYLKNYEFFVLEDYEASSEINFRGFKDGDLLITSTDQKGKTIETHISKQNVLELYHQFRMFVEKGVS
jgi:hypothetical protein